MHGHDFPLEREEIPQCRKTSLVEAQRDSLLKLKDKTRLIGPRTVSFVDNLLSKCNMASNEPSRTESFHELVEGIEKSMPFLQAKLGKDDRYETDLLGF